MSEQETHLRVHSLLKGKIHPTAQRNVQQIYPGASKNMRCDKGILKDYQTFSEIVCETGDGKVPLNFLMSK